MAQKVVTQLVDDIDGTVLDDGSGETVKFALDENAYEIDLSDKHASQLRAALETFIAAGRRLSPSKTRAQSGTRTGSQSGPPASEIRDWARSHGVDVPATGRIPRSVREAFGRR